MQAQQPTRWIPEPDPETWGDRIRRVRKKLGITQKELANVSGIPEGSLATYETSPKTVGDAARSMAISEATGCDVVWLCFGDQPVSDSTWQTMFPAYDPWPHAEWSN